MLTKQNFVENFVVTEMSNYPNILTPPMDSPEFHIFSPKSEGNLQSYSPPYAYNAALAATLMDHSDMGPSLVIVEEPVDKFRFRYKSEMAGTHGSLNGRNSDRSRKQTFPSVSLKNYYKEALIRCSLYQIGRREPHAHRLVKKIGSDEMDDPHDVDVGPDQGFIANFVNMGIIHTAKKYIIPELIRKYSVLKREEIARKEGVPRPLSNSEELEVRQKAESESNHINLNQVCLKFEAFRKQGAVLIPLCSPVYSGTINNLKSALTGDLKIVRMDHCTSTSRGGREIFILVEKVTKKNIKVRFFELDEDDNEVWSDYGRFSDLDVHHQYAIVFKTPPYKTVDIDKQVKVFIELQRPSDGARSEPKDFTYTPCEIIQGRKRPRANYSSSYNSICSSLSDVMLPSILPESNTVVNSKELEKALAENNLDSEEIKNVYQLFFGNGLGFESIYLDENVSPLTIDGLKRLQKPKVASPEENIIRRVEAEIKNFFNVSRNPHRQRVKIMLTTYLNNPRYKSNNDNNVLHLLILKSNDHQSFLTDFLKILQKYDLPEIVNLRNGLGETALHLAVKMRNKRIVEMLLKAKADVGLQDLKGLTALHIAIRFEAPETILQLLFNNGAPHEFINLVSDGITALHLAVKMGNLPAIKILCDMQADVNYPAKTNGYTALHMAVADQHTDIVTFLLDRNIDISIPDYNGHSALRLAHVLKDADKPRTLEICEILEQHLKKRGLYEEVMIKEEETLDDVSDMEIEDVEVKEEPDSLPKDSLQAKYKKVTHLPEKCTKRIADILNTSNTWKDLAEILDYGHMIRTDLFKDDANPAKSFLDFVMANGENLLRIRGALNSLGEAEAIEILDNIVKLEPVNED